jgi:hypothetical protein
MELKTKVQYMDRFLVFVFLWYAYTISGKVHARTCDVGAFSPEVVSGVYKKLCLLRVLYVSFPSAYTFTLRRQ